MDTDLRAALAAQLLAMGDNELVLGHRDSEWCGHAPILEEDIAFANLALDEIGHAHLWYTLMADLTGEDPETLPDRLVYFRPWEEFRCVPLVELPRGDWAFAILRQYFFDAAESIRLRRLSESRFTPLAETAAKIGPEESYHLRHTSAWVRRLGQGTGESRSRMQQALVELWPHTAQLFGPLPDEHLLAAAGWLPESAALREEWESLVRPLLEECGLVIQPGTGYPMHSPYLKLLVEEMQSVARLDEEAVW